MLSQNYEASPPCVLPEPCPSAGQDDRWRDLTIRIRESEPGAAREWIDVQWRAVWLLLRRRLGSAATPALARAALAEAIVEVRTGRLDGPEQLVAWLGGYAARQESTFPLPRVPTPAAMIGLQVSRLAQALDECEARDREAMRRYYIEGHPADIVAREMGFTPEEFRRIRVKIRGLVKR